MNRNLLSGLVIGVVAGFLGGYLAGASRGGEAAPAVTAAPPGTGAPRPNPMDLQERIQSTRQTLAAEPGKPG